MTQPVEVPDEAVDAEIERLRLTVAELRPVERRGRRGRLRRHRLRGHDRRQAVRRGAGTDYGVELGAGRLVAELEQRHHRHERRATSATIDLPLPPDHEDASMAGKIASFHVSVKDVKERVLPPLDDELATVGERVRHARRAPRRHPRAVREGARSARSDRLFRSLGAGVARGPADTPTPRAMVRNRAGRPGPRAASATCSRAASTLEDYLRVTGQTGSMLAA